MFKVEITPLMNFKHPKMLNSASKCLKIPLKVKVIKNQVIPPCQIHAGGKSPRMRWVLLVNYRTQQHHCTRPTNQSF
jgi:hypothetical protein